MTFNEFLQAHQCLDFVWELFKGISPTLIAVATIITNNRITKKRNEKTIMDKEINDILNRVIKLIPLVSDVGLTLIDYLQSDAKDRDKFEMYLKADNMFIRNFKETKYYLKLKAKTLKKKEINFDEIFSSSYIYSVNVQKVHDSYCEIVKEDMNDTKRTNIWKNIADELTIQEDIMIDYLEEYCNNLIQF